MLLLLSPAKKLDYSTPTPALHTTQPIFLEQAQQLIHYLRPYTAAQLAELMHISTDLAQLNVERFQTWQPPFTKHNAKPALFAFAGEVYEQLQAASLSPSALTHARKHLRILSGLYGLLQPFDLMQAYRLEMGTRLKHAKGADLYRFWGALITEQLNQELATKQSNLVINLASQEYFKVIKAKKLHASVVSPCFKDWQNGQYRVVSFFAKRARGLMTRYILEQEITELEALFDFKAAGYSYRPDLTQKPQEPVFARDNTD